MQNLRRASIALSGASDDSCSCIEHTLKLDGDDLGGADQKAAAVVDFTRHESMNESSRRIVVEAASYAAQLA